MDRTPAHPGSDLQGTAVIMLTQELPENIERRVREKIGEEAIRYSLASDLTLSRQFGASYIVVTDTKVIVCDDQHHAVAVELADLKEARMDELFGSGRITAVLDSAEMPLIYYTKVIVPEFESDDVPARTRLY